ncbi:hypothetical protein B9Q02_08295 [Candidatus Marsarchaeota G1 archaeon BE_D]|jgi:Predicted hydrolases or acyltransferases (alpha/beta hydrolase superfamily)|uniref:AB hydrolase-1 domain-containing protein n=1 Tax=Candidatus Marsarchaeota G1 archaeon BE_D TaxID=1978156 RepID=A0A2R6AEV2_9ARCH|nr:MAG: hypothetical protein B9Q02_08295 [Candidatus Marsarchaeota G1 archaeon BE_D]
MNYDNTRIELSNLVLECRIEGTSEPALVLLHGLSAHSGSWRKNFPVFAKQRKVIAPSFPRFEVSPQKLAQIYAQITEELLDSLRVRSAILVGNSLGGMIAMLYALKRPNCVCAVVLENSAGVEIAESFSKTNIPTLIIWGKKDHIIPVDTAYVFKTKIANSELVIFEDAAHVPHWEVPSRFNESVLRFTSEKC